MTIPTLSTAKLIGFGIGLIGVLGFIALALSWRSDRNDLRDWQGGIVSAVRAEVPLQRRKSVTARTASDEIQWLGRELRTASEALRVQSERLVIAGRKATAAQNGAAEARRRATEADKDRSATRSALTNPKRSTGLSQTEWSKL